MVTSSACFSILTLSLLSPAVVQARRKKLLPITGVESTEESDVAITNVISLIDAIPAIEIINETNQLAIKAARTAYDALSDEQKDLVTNLDTLVQKENAYASLVNVNECH